jgi:hypothetical protein
MRNLLFITVIFWLNVTVLSSQACLPDGIIFSDQSQVDAFIWDYPGCHKIEGDVIIIGSIDNLNGLVFLDSIGGNFTINGTFLVNFTSLSNLVIGGNLLIAENSTLNDLSGLSNIKVGGNFEINDCELTSLSGMEGMSIGGGISIINLSHITNLIGLNAFNKINNQLIISKNTNLTSVYELGALETIAGDLVIEENNNLKSLTGFGNLKTINGKLDIVNNVKLENINALSGLDSVYASVRIYSNDSLQNLNGFINLRYIGGRLSLLLGAKLTEIQGFNNLEKAMYGVYINSLYIESINGFNKLDTLFGHFIIANCNSLKYIYGFNSVKSIEGYLQFYNNNKLKNVFGFTQLHSIGITLSVGSNPKLDSLTGLSNLRYIKQHLFIDNNIQITNIKSLSECYVEKQVLIQNNVSLSSCAIYSVCDKIVNDPANVNVFYNAVGCNEIQEIEPDCNGLPVRAKVKADFNGNCQVDADDVPIGDIQVTFSAHIQRATRNTNIDGVVKFGYLDTGIFYLTLPQFPTNNWAICQDTIWVNPDSITDTAHLVFLLKPLNNCPQLHNNLNLPPFFRGCLVNSKIEITNQNVGGGIASNTKVAVVIPNTLSVVSTIPPISNTVGDTLYFDTGDLIPFQSATVTIMVHTSCDTFLLGSTLCLEAMGFLDNPCPPIQETSDVRVYSECLSDTTVRFNLKNILGGATQNPHEYIIIEDEIVLMANPFNLGPYGSMIVDVPANGTTYRMEATQLEDGTLIATANEGCGGFTPGFVTAFWLNYHLSDYDYDCREVVLAYDPNQKTAIPKGIGEQHLLPANRPITYTIDFQNTGTDTAFRVLLRDVLSQHLDVTTFRPGASSNPYTWEIRGLDTLEVLFQPIMLPDSNVNEAASHGWFSFTIDQQPDLADGTLIENTASIIFDYNPPIITNTTFHTIGQLTVSIDEISQQPNAGLWKVLSNPTITSATLLAVKAIPGEKKFELVNTAGMVVRSQAFSGQRFDFERKNLPSGLYYFTITDQQGRVFSGKIMVK